MFLYSDQKVAVLTDLYDRRALGSGAFDFNKPHGDLSNGQELAAHGAAVVLL